MNPGEKGKAVREMTPDLSTARWRKSSRSSGQGGECVELACLHTASWRKSSRSSGQGGNCVELACLHNASWRKSTRSSGQNGACVELAHAGAIRDSKNPTGPALRTDLGTLLTAVKAGRFDS
jgi:hypothetical protein